ncbi:hypothetical protein KGQ71_02925 [Patescibacteria group bacterium]|nr:hypothetical protein [Patescibacteria group bacterium]
MGQKSRNKKNRRSQATGQNRAPQKPREIIPASLAGGGVAKAPTVSNAVAANQKNLSPLDIQTEYIRSDILKISLLLLLVALLLVVLYLTNDKTILLSHAGERLTSFLRL